MDDNSETSESSDGARESGLDNLMMSMKFIGENYHDEQRFLPVDKYRIEQFNKLKRQFQ